MAGTTPINRIYAEGTCGEGRGMQQLSPNKATSEANSELMKINSEFSFCLERLSPWGDQDEKGTILSASILTEFVGSERQTGSPPTAKWKTFEMEGMA